MEDLDKERRMCMKSREEVDRNGNDLKGLRSFLSKRGLEFMESKRLLRDRANGKVIM